MDLNKGRSDPSNLNVSNAKVLDLRRFLRYRSLPVSGSKNELIERVKGAQEIGKTPLQVFRNRDENLAEERKLEWLVSPLGEKLPDLSELKSGWSDDTTSIPCVTNNDLYNYLILNNSRTFDNKPLGAKRQLKAKVFYADRHLHSMKFHEIERTLSHCYVKALVMPSIPTQKENKKDYVVFACLSKITGQVHAAGCDCEAGDGEACNHVAALLYGLVDMTEKKKDGLDASTSKDCLWNKPRARKLSPKQAKDLIFKKQKFCGSIKGKSFQTYDAQIRNIQNTPKPVNIQTLSDKLQKCNPHAGHCYWYSTLQNSEVFYSFSCHFNINSKVGYSPSLLHFPTCKSFVFKRRYYQLESSWCWHIGNYKSFVCHNGISTFTEV